MSQPIFIPTLMGGVARIAPSQRPAHTAEDLDNVIVDFPRGIDKRAGSQHIESDETDGGDLPIDVNETANNRRHVHWIDRDEDGEQFLMLVNSYKDDTDADFIQVFDLEGNAQTVEYDSDNPRPYLKVNEELTAQRRIGSLTVADATFLLNRTVIAQPKGSELTYSEGGNPVRQTSHPNNFPAWSDFPQPPPATDVVYYSREDDVGRPQGFYRSVSTTSPPWYERIRTEPPNSEVDEDTMPVQLRWDGEKFELFKIDWTDRLSGDSFTNPGPTFFGNWITAIVFHQNRLFALSGERIVASRAADVFNWWINSEIILVDSDPIDIGLTNNKISNIQHAVPFRDSLVLLTEGTQHELRSDGPLTPSTAFLWNATNIPAVRYVAPTTLGEQMYFLSEVDFSHDVYEFMYNQGQLSNTALSITDLIDDYIPAEASQIEASEQHNQLFITTDAEKNHLYCYSMVWRGEEKVVSAWYRWVFDEDTEIASIKAYGEFLYMLVYRDGKAWLEKVAINAPEQDVDLDTLVTMGFAVRLDRRMKVQGVYDSDSQTTSWTIPFEDSKLTEIVLGPEWDINEDNIYAGLRLEPEVSVGSGETVLTLDGNYQTNGSEDIPVFVGRPYTMRVKLNQQYVRDENGNAIDGMLNLLLGRIRYADAGYMRVEVKRGRAEPMAYEFVPYHIGSSEFNEPPIKETGQYTFPILGSSTDVDIEILNDSPLPSGIIDLTIMGRFRPGKNSPTRT